MIYGNVFLPKEDKSNYVNEFEVSSIVYDEYINRKSLLEACTSEEDKPILEAQIQVLYEVSIKDLFNTIIKKIKDFIKWLKETINELISKVKEYFKNRKSNKAKEILKKIGKGKVVKSNESAYVYEAVNTDSINNEEFFYKYSWLINDLNVESSKFKEEFSKLTQTDNVDNKINDILGKINRHEFSDNKYSEEKLQEEVDDIIKEIDDSSNVVKNIEYVPTVKDRYSKLHEAIKNKTIFETPERFLVPYKSFADYLVEEDYYVGVYAMEFLIQESEKYEEAKYKSSLKLEKGYKELAVMMMNDKGAKPIYNNEFNMLESLALQLYTKWMKVSKEIANNYKIATSKAVKASEMLYRKMIILAEFAVNNNAKLGYLPDDEVFIRTTKEFQDKRYKVYNDYK